MKKTIKRYVPWLVLFAMLFSLVACTVPAVGDGGQNVQISLIDKNGTYTTKDEVALYIREYGKLPSNFITKDEARALGWQSGGLEKYAPGKCIGGDVFGNREGLLPEKAGRVYYECDIGTLGADSRGAKRIVGGDTSGT